MKTRMGEEYAEVEGVSPKGDSRWWRDDLPLSGERRKNRPLRKGGGQKGFSQKKVEATKPQALEG